MSYARPPKINWAKALADPRDYELLQHERMRRAHANAWKESSDERDGRVVQFAGVGAAGVLVMGYDHRAEFMQATTPSNATLSTLARKARHARQGKMTQQGNRHVGGSN